MLLRPCIRGKRGYGKWPTAAAGPYQVPFADITEAGFDLLTWRKGPDPDRPASAFTTIACADDRGREHEHDPADTTITLGIS